MDKRGLLTMLIVLVTVDTLLIIGSWKIVKPPSSYLLLALVVYSNVRLYLAYRKRS